MRKQPDRNSGGKVVVVQIGAPEEDNTEGRGKVSKTPKINHVNPSQPVTAEVQSPVEENKHDKLTVPEGVVIPTKGTALWKWRANKLFNISDTNGQGHYKVPKLGKKEQAEHDAAAEAERLHRESEAAEARRRELEASSIDAIKTLNDTVQTAAVAFVNTKGGAATTTSTAYAASVMAEISRSTLIVLDANPAAGSLAERLGKETDDTLSVQELVRDCEGRTPNFRELIREIRPTRYSVRVVSGNPIVDKERRLYGKNYQAILSVLKSNCEYLFADTGNEIAESVTLTVASEMDVLVFTANAEVATSLRRLATSMETLRRQGFEKRVERSVVVISNLPPGANLDDYHKFLHRTDIRDEVVENYAPHRGPFLGIPYDPEIKRDGEVNLEALQPETIQAYRGLVIAILEQRYEDINEQPYAAGSQPHLEQPHEWPSEAPPVQQLNYSNVTPGESPVTPNGSIRFPT